MNKRPKTHLVALKVQSFVTSLVQNEEKKIKGGLDTITPPYCPPPTLHELPDDTWGALCSPSGDNCYTGVGITWCNCG